MSKTKLAKRILSGLLALGLAAGAASSASADTMTIDDTGFTDPTITKGTVYYWHRGLPPDTVDGTSYPVLITWDGKYYFAADDSFYSEVVGNNKTQYARDLAGNYSNKMMDPQDIPYSDSSSTTPNGWYHSNRAYNAHSTDDLPFDFSVLKKTGTAVSIGAPLVPRFVAAKAPLISEGGHLVYHYYGIWLPKSKDEKTTATAAHRWLIGTHRIYSYYKEVGGNVYGTYARYINSFDWFLDVMNKPQSEFLNESVSYTPAHNGLNSRGYEARPNKTGFSNRTWYAAEYSDQAVTEQGDLAANCAFYTVGAADASLRSFYADTGRSDLMHYVSSVMSTSSEIMLAHSGGRMFSFGNSGNYYRKGTSYNWDNRWEDKISFGRNDYFFTCYWGEPATISFCQLDFTVQSGQVQTMDGPIAISHDTVITVEDGGVLACSDWIINNGTIVVKPGGTLLLQTYETANQQTRYGTISTIHDAAGTDGGRILCDGTIIVMPDCKLCCSGTYGLQLGEGAQVVNYGAIVAENLSVAQSYTIENRGNDSRVFAGYGLKDCGSSLLTERITGDTFTEKGTYIGSGTINLPANAIYGKGVTRIYKNTASGYTYTSNTLSGYVTDEVTDLPPLPDDPAGPGGKLAQMFTLPENKYTIYYPDTQQSHYTDQAELTFVVFQDPEQTSYATYTAQGYNDEWYDSKIDLDTSKRIQVYQSYYNPELSLSQKLLFDGYIYEWDGSDQHYFDPPEVEEEPLVDTRLSDTYYIEGNMYLRAKSRILLYEEADCIYLRYSNEVKDYIEKTVLDGNMNCKIYHQWTDSNYRIYSELEYEGILKDWRPIYVLDE